MSTSALFRDGLEPYLIDPTTDGPTGVVRMIVADAIGVELPYATEYNAFLWYSENFQSVDAVVGRIVPSRLRDAASSQAYRTGRNATAAQDFAEFRRQLDSAGATGLAGLPTGIGPVDRALGGIGEVVVLSGPTGAGKTTLAQAVALGVVRTQDAYACLYLDFEQSRSPLFLRWLAMESGVPVQRLAAGGLTPAERDQRAAAERRLAAECFPFVRVVSPAPNPYAEGLDFAWFRSEIKATAAATGRPYCLLVVDSLSRMPVAGRLSEGSDRGPAARVPDADAAKARMELLLTVQRWTQSPGCPRGFPIIAISRTRKTDGSGIYGVEDVLGSVETVYDASTVLILEPDGPSTDPRVTPIRLGIKKHRNSSGLGDVRLNFHHDVAAFRERSASPAPLVGRADQPARIPGKR